MTLQRVCKRAKKNLFVRMQQKEDQEISNLLLQKYVELKTKLTRLLQQHESVANLQERVTTAFLQPEEPEPEPEVTCGGAQSSLRPLDTGLRQRPPTLLCSFYFTSLCTAFEFREITVL